MAALRVIGRCFTTRDDSGNARSLLMGDRGERPTISGIGSVKWDDTTQISIRRFSSGTVNVKFYEEIFKSPELLRRHIPLPTALIIISYIQL